MAPAPTVTSTTSATLARTIIVTSSTSTSLAIPQAPPAGSIYSSSTSNGWSPSSIIGIVTAIVLICLSVPLIAVILRRYQKKRLRETLPDGASSKASLRSVREDQSLKSIMVTREVQRTSTKLSVDVRTPERAYGHEKEWSRAEVHGGGWK